MLLDLWQSVWEVQPLCRQLECWDFIVFLTPCPLALEASPPPGARPRLRQAPYPCLGRPARGAADCQSQSCSVSQLAGRRQRAELPERVIWQPWRSSSHHTRALLVRGLEIITAYPAGWVECFSCTIGLAYFYWILNIQFQSNSKECAQGFRSAWLPPLCSRVWKFIILNNGKITEAFPARTSDSKEPSVPTPLGHMLTVAEAVVLIQVPHYSGHDGQANFFRWWKKGEWSGVGRGRVIGCKRIQVLEVGTWKVAYRGQDGETRCTKVWHQLGRVGGGDPKALTLEGENNCSGSQEQL